MKWGFAQGMIGRRIASLHAPATAMGPNTYLGQHDFLKMMGMALAAHLIVFLIAGLFPHEKVTNIPVRALSFKLGDGERVAAMGTTSGVSVTMNQPAPPVMGSHESWRATASAPAPKLPAPLQKPVEKPVITRSYLPTPVKPPKIVPIEPPAPRQVPVENTPLPAAKLPSIAPLLQASPAIAPAPQQYVREVGSAPPQGTANGVASGQGTQNTAATMQEIRARYEQQISSWVDRHMFYPAGGGGAKGRVVVRMRIDRSGTVRYYAIEQSSGNPTLDAAAIDIIRRANPVPAVPADYPAGNLIEFLIPLIIAP